ncbi:SDR family NAD(P)-dependent oxidoreductase [Phytoactinopolyspora endophytica]|uniref:SDR family NAD(P)-dependent oxidoreductase n=1 Tax=Phytoactinopolyspora endophytica TaxID=1642495 RepID=UPI00101C6CD8|nr:SDR family NAD(P)-dependent oxidoreductase [Phytoactinopolyspora endophytica]
MSTDTVVVTGAGSGIGRATCLALASRGARVAVVDIDGAAARTVAEESLRTGAAAAIPVECDVSSEMAVQAAFEQVGVELGAPSGTFANAGIEANAPLHQLSSATWQQMIDVNLTGLFLTCREAVRLHVAAGRGGSIVCTSSPAAFIGHSGGGNSAYAASKGGISAFVRSTAIDYASHGIRVNAVVPGATDTALLLAGVDDDERDVAAERIRAAAREQVPLGRLARPEEIAAAVVWLLSDDSSYVTGTHLVCDGGLMAKSANDF